jgi:hypothetical protein
MFTRKIRGDFCDGLAVQAQFPEVHAATSQGDPQPAAPVVPTTQDGLEIIAERLGHAGRKAQASVSYVKPKTPRVQ